MVSMQRLWEKVVVGKTTLLNILATFDKATSGSVLLNNLDLSKLKDKELADLRFSKGSTIASGLVAGGAIGSLFSAVLRIAGIDVFAQEWVETPEATYLSIVMYLLLCVFLYKVVMYVKAKKAK